MRIVHVAVIAVAAMVVIVGMGIWLLEGGPGPLGSPPPGLPPADPDNPGDGPEARYRELEEADLVALFPAHVVRAGPGDQRLVALTFDDGPDDRYTPQILDVLRRERVPATFFVTGVRAQENPQVLRRIIRDGHAVGNHGYLHARYAGLTPAQIEADLQENVRLLRQHGVSDNRLFRPPYGALGVQGAETVIAQKYTIVLWTIDPRDWLSPPADQIVDTVLANIRPGAIILLHSAGGPGQSLEGTVEALPRIIRALRDQGYRFVTVPDLLHS
ncbi:MAG TPA: polysaccharide deacetylase family protein [Sphingobacteriaceae bacterium]|nr:polysaccharide deacetylase family protein [Sphingobacteriaceae bacterium]